MTLSADNRVSEFVTTPRPSRRAAWWPQLAGTPAGRFIGLTLLALLLAFLTVYPLSMLLYGSLHSTPPGAAGVFNLDGYRDIFTQTQSAGAAQHHRHLAGQDRSLGDPRRVPGLDPGAHRHAVSRLARGAGDAAVLHPADPDRDGLGHARQSAGRPAQPASSGSPARRPRRSTSIPMAAWSGT